ncbi:MAG: antitoxin [Acidimicrobiia bacterium]
MYTRRLQILLDEERYERVAREAARRKVSVATVVREAIDGKFPSPADIERRRSAIEGILSAAPMPVPDDPADLRKELDDAHARVSG